jgi:hypothetical protein
LEDMKELLDEATSFANDLADALSRVVAAQRGVGGALSGIGFEGGAGFRKGVGFQQGTLGFRVPQGFPNDTFPINVTSGERIVVAPPGRSIEEVVAPRMMRLLAGSMGPRMVTVQVGPNSISTPMDLAMVEAVAARVIRRIA